MISISPSLMKIGTCTTRPVSNVAGFVTLEAVSPLIPGSVSVTCNSTVFGSSTPSTSLLVSHNRYFHVFF